MKSLYNKKSLQFMNAAEACGFSENRIEQIRSFALAAQFTRLGIAHCITFSSEARVLQEYFAKNFEVVCVDCKYGRLRRAELFEEYDGGVLCNPAGQADFLNKASTDLNLSVGLCVGHDMIFNHCSQAPVTTLFTKDFTNQHNPAKAVEAISTRLGRQA